MAGKRVAVFGLGGSGLATARALIAGGADVAAWDDGAAAREKATSDGVPVVDLLAADWSDFTALVLAPGVPLTHPEPHWTVKLAQAAGVEVIGDVEIFFRERAAQQPDATVVAITGTNGKSTTTALTAHLLREAGRDVAMGGNIGVPVLALPPFAPARIYVLELSSFQIDLTPSLAPNVGVLLNISPDHLDRHGPADDPDKAMRNYTAIKERLVAKANTAIRGEANAPAITGIATLRGRHNAQNAAAAAAIARTFAISDSEIASALQTFPGLPHRMEEVGTLEKPGGRVLFINDSKATNADSTDKALASFPGDIHWILGGKPKEGGIATLAPYFPRIARAYVIGEAADAFAATLEGKVACERTGTLEAAVAVAARNASASAAGEAVVLLSPACASYDQFRSFEHRGDTFRNLVAAVPGIEMRPRA